jgi:hypothetical protein
MGQPNYQGAIQGITAAQQHLERIKLQYQIDAPKSLHRCFSTGNLVGWDEIRLCIEKHQGPNPVPASWGGIQKQLVANGFIEKQMLRKNSTIKKCHARNIPYYRIL